MNRTTRTVVAFAVLALVAILLLRCIRAPAPPPPENGAAAPSPAAPARPPAGSAQPGGQGQARTVTQPREQAMQDAVSMVHRYLTALGTGDPAKSDTFWSGGRPPRTRNEADLPTLQGLRSLRIENGTPRPLDSAPLPEALEVPVSLRAGMKDSPARRYSGYYRVRRTLDKQGWEITSARIDAEPARQ